MPIRKGDRVAHIDGILGTALADQSGGTVEVIHDSGVITTWTIRNAAIVRPGVGGPAPHAAEPPAGRRRKRAATKRSKLKRRAARKPKAKRATTRKSAKKPRRKKARAKKPRKPASRRRKGGKGRLAKK